MHKRLICAPETVAHISRQISNVPLQCLLHSGTIINHIVLDNNDNKIKQRFRGKHHTGTLLTG